MLQEAVDAAFDQRPPRQDHHGPEQAPAEVALRHAQGKQGRFRQNLLVSASTTRVARSSSSAPAFACTSAVSEEMALELFKPFIYKQARRAWYVTTIKARRSSSEKEKPEVWDILEE